jgi:hypothetical protein
MDTSYGDFERSRQIPLRTSTPDLTEATQENQAGIYLAMNRTTKLHNFPSMFNFLKCSDVVLVTIIIN